MIVEIDGHPVAIPADSEVATRSPEFAPVAFAAGACLFARLATSTAERVPVKVVAPLIGSTLVASAIARRRLDQRGSAAQGEVELMGLAISGVATILATVTSRRPFKPSGGQNFPFYATLTMPMLVYAFQRRDLSSAMQRTMPIGFLAIAGSGWVLAPRPRQFGQYLLALTWPLAGFLSGMSVSGEFRVDAVRLAESLRVREATAVDEAFDRGAAAVVQLARAAYGDAQKQLEQRRDDLDPELVEVAERRLQEVELCLKQLDATA